MVDRKITWHASAKHNRTRPIVRSNSSLHMILYVSCISFSVEIVIDNPVDFKRQPAILFTRVALYVCDLYSSIISSLSRDYFYLYTFLLMYIFINIINIF